MVRTWTLDLGREGSALEGALGAGRRPRPQVQGRRGDVGRGAGAPVPRADAGRHPLPRAAGRAPVEEEDEGDSRGGRSHLPLRHGQQEAPVARDRRRLPCHVACHLAWRLLLHQGPSSSQEPTREQAASTQQTAACIMVRRAPSLGPAVARSGCRRVLLLQFLRMNCARLFMLTVSV
jgi:hypothetical protein